MADKIFVGRVFEQKKPWGIVPQLVLKQEDLDLLKSYLSETEKYGKQVKVNICYGKSGKPYAEIDTWKPDGQRSDRMPDSPPATTTDESSMDNLPF